MELFQPLTSQNMLKSLKNKKQRMTTLTYVSEEERVNKVV